VTARGLLLGLFLSVAAVQPAFALKVVPFVAEFEPRGAGANRTFQVENDTGQPAAVQLTMVHRDMDENGQEKLVEDDKNFVVFPAQLVLLPHESRAVRVQWLGDPNPKSELTYRLIIEQLPVQLGKVPPRAGQVRITLRYETAIYVVPAGAKGAIAVEKAGAVRGANGANMLALTLRNTGTAHVILENPVVSLKGGSATVSLSGDRQLKGLVSENVLPGHTRRFLLPWPKSLPQGPIEAAIKLSAAK
jgi:fimbrial chaperone protein